MKLLRDSSPSSSLTSEHVLPDQTVLVRHISVNIMRYGCMFLFRPPDNPTLKLHLRGAILCLGNYYFVLPFSDIRFLVKSLHDTIFGIMYLSLNLYLFYSLYLLKD
jgi:hypothetical protein